MRRPTRQSFALVLELVFSTLALRADVTVRYKIDYKFTPSLPSAVTGPALHQMGSSMPTEAITHLKGDKGYWNFGKLTYLMNFSKQEVTLLDAPSKRFATLPMKDFADKLGGSLPATTPEVQRSMESIKTNFSSRKTGRTDTIQGIDAEESEWTISMDMAQPIGTQPAGPFMKMAMQIWSAKPEEALRVPALREWAGYAAYSNYLMNPMTTMQKIFATMPGAAKGYTSMMEEGSKSLMLRSHVAVYMPMMSKLAPGFDPNAAVMDISGEIAELSAEPVNDSVFQLPDGYRSVPIEDLMKSVIAPPAATPPSVPPPAPAPSGPAPQRIRVGGNVQAANLIQKVEPVYPPLAQQNGIEGTVRFTVIIDKEGHVSNVQLVTGHPVLVEAARNAVMQWMYKPTLLNGQPVEVVTQVDISFKLQ
jgi:TonB family protein